MRSTSLCSSDMYTNNNGLCSGRQTQLCWFSLPLLCCNRGRAKCDHITLLDHHCVSGCRQAADFPNDHVNPGYSARSDVDIYINRLEERTWRSGSHQDHNRLAASVANQRNYPGANQWLLQSFPNKRNHNEHVANCDKWCPCAESQR